MAFSTAVSLFPPPSLPPWHAASLCQYLTATFLVSGLQLPGLLLPPCLGVLPFVIAVLDVCISLVTELAAHAGSSSPAIRAKMLTHLSSMIISYCTDMRLRTLRLPPIPWWVFVWTG